MQLCYATPHRQSPGRDSDSDSDGETERDLVHDAAAAALSAGCVCADEIRRCDRSW